MNNETTSDTPETDAAIEQYAHLLPNWLATDIVGAVARKLERERNEAKFDADDESRWAMSYKTQRDEWVAKAEELSAERESNAMQALVYKAELDESRASLAAAEAWSATLADVGDDFRAANAELRAAIRNLRDVQGRHHTQIATERLFALLPEVSQPERG